MVRWAIKIYDAPWKWAIFYCFLTIFSPSITIFKMIYFTFSNKSKTWLPNSLLPLLFRLAPAIYIYMSDPLKYMSRVSNYFHNGYLAIPNR